MGSTSATPDSATDTVTGAAGPLAALDIGTNSFHLVVARPVGRDRFETLTREKEVVRLGHGGGDMKVMTAEAIDRGIACLRRMRRIADSYDATPRAVATSAVREAANAQAFLDRARTEAGIDIEVISGAEEARLIHLGVLQAVPVYRLPPAPRRRRRRFDRAAARPSAARRSPRAASRSERCASPTASSAAGTSPRRAVNACRAYVRDILSHFQRAVDALRLRRRGRLVRHGRGDRPRRPRRHGCRAVADVQLLRVHPQGADPRRRRARRPPHRDRPSQGGRPRAGTGGHHRRRRPHPGSGGDDVRGRALHVQRGGAARRRARRHRQPDEQRRRRHQRHPPPPARRLPAQHRSAGRTLRRRPGPLGSRRPLGPRSCSTSWRPCTASTPRPGSTSRPGRCSPTSASSSPTASTTCTPTT